MYKKLQSLKKIFRKFELSDDSLKSRDILIPLEYAEKYQVKLRDLVEKKKSKELEDLIFDLASRANANVTKVGIFTLAIHLGNKI